MPPKKKRKTTGKKRKTTGKKSKTRAIRPDAGTTAILPDAGTTAMLPESGTTAMLPESGTTAMLPESGTTAMLSESETTAILPDAGTTAMLPESETTAMLPESETTAMLPDPGTTAKLPESGTTAKLPESGTTAILPESGTTSILPDNPSNIFEEYSDEPLQMIRIVRKPGAPKHAYGKVPASFLEKFSNNGSTPNRKADDTCPPGDFPGDFVCDFSYGPRTRRIRKVDPALLMQMRRKRHANQFRLRYTYGVGTMGGVRCDNVVEQKFLIRSNALYTWQALSSGVSWVAVYVMNTICVVTKNKDLDVKRWEGLVGDWKNKKDGIFFYFKNSLVAEVENLANPSGKICKKYNWSISKPFAVVSLIPDSEESDNEAPSVYYQDSSIKYLTEKLQDCSNFTCTETIQTAISAFQHLFDKKFEADEIKVTVFEEEVFKEGLVSPLECHGKSLNIRALDISDITKHLAVIKCQE